MVQAGQLLFKGGYLRDLLLFVGGAGLSF